MTETRDPLLPSNAAAPAGTTSPYQKNLNHHQNDPNHNQNDRDAEIRFDPSVHDSPHALNYINLAAYLVNVVVTYGVAAWSGLPSNGELSAKYQTLITPAGWAFAIWGPIFIAQAVWVVACLIRWASRAKQTTIGLSYVYIVAAQSAWTLVFAHELIVLSAVVMAILCACLWRAVVLLWREQHESLYFLYVFPFTLHAGWITAATAVNLNVALVAWNASAQVQFDFALVSLIVLGVVACVLLVHRNDTTMPLVVAWALLGVFAELQSPPNSIQQRFSNLQMDVASMGSILLAAVIVVLAVAIKIRSSVTLHGQ